MQERGTRTFENEGVSEIQACLLYTSSDWSCGNVDDRFLYDYLVGGFGTAPAERIADFLNTVITQRSETLCPNSEFEVRTDV